MAKIKTSYICSECGYETPKWFGKCPNCGEWNTLNEELPAPEIKKRRKKHCYYIKCVKIR